MSRNNISISRIMYSKMPTKRKIGIFFGFGWPSIKKTTSKTTAGPAKDNYQASTNYLKLHIEAVIGPEAWTIAVQLKSAA